MTTATDDNKRIEQIIPRIVETMAADPLCLEVRHYPATNELAGEEKLHLLIIMERELKQAERRERIKNLNEIAGEQGLRVDVIFSSPRVWRDLANLVGPFTQVQRQAIVDWQRQ